MNTRKEKICIFIGSHRPAEGKSDSGEDIVLSLIHQGVKVSTVYLRPNDPIKGKLQKKCDVQIIPKIMRQPRNKILESFEKENYLAEWKRWLSKFQSEEFTLGIVYFGSWLSPELFNSPKLGFINFHPGPLPSLRGFEAETWAILTGMSFFYGTVHRVSSEYDEGEILWRTPLIRIRKRETPESLLNRTCYMGVYHIHKIVKQLHQGSWGGNPQKISDGMVASIKLVSTLARVDWTRDSLSMLDRKNRAFNGQYISVPLVVNFEGEDRIIRDILMLPGQYRAGLGSHIGEYTKKGKFEKKDMFQALDGIAVVDLLPSGSKKPPRATVFAGYRDDNEVDLD